MKTPHVSEKLTLTHAQIKAWEERPYSWSQHSSFKFDKMQWLERYIIGKKSPPNLVMEFGSVFGKSVENGEPMMPVDTLSHFEYKLECELDGFQLIGYIDSYEPHTKLREYKTGQALWTQKKADDHGQLTMYALMLNMIHQVRPEDIEMWLQWVPTCEQEDETWGFAPDAEVHTFKTKRTMRDIMKFTTEIKESRAAMNSFIHTFDLQD